MLILYLALFILYSIIAYLNNCVRLKGVDREKREANEEIEEGTVSDCYSYFACFI